MLPTEEAFKVKTILPTYGSKPRVMSALLKVNVFDCGIMWKVDYMEL